MDVGLRERERERELTAFSYYPKSDVVNSIPSSTITVSIGRYIEINWASKEARFFINTLQVCLYLYFEVIPFESQFDLECKILQVLLDTRFRLILKMLSTRLTRIS